MPKPARPGLDAADQLAALLDGVERRARGCRGSQGEHRPDRRREDFHASHRHASLRLRGGVMSAVGCFSGRKTAGRLDCRTYSPRRQAEIGSMRRTAVNFWACLRSRRYCPTMVRMTPLDVRPSSADARAPYFGATRLMKKITKRTLPAFGENTRLVVGGRDPAAYHGFVNPPVYHGSTVLAPTVKDLVDRTQPYVYGRRGTPTSVGARGRAEGDRRQCAGVVLCPSGPVGRVHGPAQRPVARATTS